MKKIGISGLFVLLFVLFFPLPKPVFKNDYSVVILDTHGEIIRVFLNKRDQWHFSPQPEVPIPEKLKASILLFEDRFFYWHPGVNVFSFIQAWKDNRKAHRIVRGGSTITMQLARLATPKERTYINKCSEIIQALKLELLYSKNELLHLYVDHAPYGSNVVGYQAASLKYFGKEPLQLTWAESALLAVLPNAPSYRSPIKRQDELEEKRNQLLLRLYKNKSIDQLTYDSSLEEPLPHEMIEFNFDAPHFARFVKSKYPKEFRIQTTLDKAIQRRVKQMVDQNMSYLSSLGAVNCAVVVAETKTGSVRAYIGSQSFRDSDSQGQVDGVQAPRSTGSLLKPFLYALSIDNGLVLPETLIKDLPSFYGTYSPSNPLKTYNGLVSVNDALIRSLNVPPVRLLNEYGLESFCYFLKSAGMSTLFRSGAEYGLPLILGGAEGTLWDLAALFKGLGTQGLFSPLIVKGEADPGISLISPGASSLILDVLRNVKRPGVNYYWEHYGGRFPVAWKTGTSYGQKDAWSIGVSPEWVVGVWVGDFTGEGNDNLSGSKFAGPLLFDVFNALPKSLDQRWFDEDDRWFSEIRCCKETGYVAGPYCSEVVFQKTPVNVSLKKVCPYHKTVVVNESETYQVCSLCWDSSTKKSIQRLVYPSELIQFYSNQGSPYSTILPHNPDCPGQRSEGHISILYPTEGARIFLPKDIGENQQQLTFEVVSQFPDEMLYWYLDDQYLGSTQSEHKRSVSCSLGSHVLTVEDEKGGRASVSFSTIIDSFF